MNDDEFEGAADRITAFVEAMHADNMTRSEQRRVTLYLYGRPGTVAYEREALELWAEGACEYARRLMRGSSETAERQIRQAWYCLGALHRLLIGLEPHRRTHRTIANAIRNYVYDCETAEGDAACARRRRETRRRHRGHTDPRRAGEAVSGGVVSNHGACPHDPPHRAGFEDCEPPGVAGRVISHAEAVDVDD